MHSPTLAVSSRLSSKPEDFSSASIILEHDLNYFKRRGALNTLIAFSLLFFWFFILPVLLEPAYHWWHSLFSNPQLMHFVTTILVSDFSYLGINLAFVLLYWLKHPVVEKSKVLEDPWPWEKDPKGWSQVLSATIWNLALNNLVYLPISLLAFNLIMGFVHKHSPEGYPSHLEIILNFAVLTIAEDTMFYWSHRLLHYGWFYTNIHKKHHEYKISVSFAAEYAHPIEFIFGNALALNMGIILLGPYIHVVTIYLWIAFAVITVSYQHSGYEFKWFPAKLLPFTITSGFHNYHHEKNVGNFGGTFVFWDTICGTQRSYYRHMKRKGSLQQVTDR